MKDTVRIMGHKSAFTINKNFLLMKIYQPTGFKSSVDWFYN